MRFGFEAERIGDYVIGHIPTSTTNLRLADAVAISASVPGPFNATKLKGLTFPCGDGADTRLLDGGVYDNLGLEAVDDLHGPCLIAVSAGGVLRVGARGLMSKVPVLRDLHRSNALLYRQATSLRTRTMIDRFKAWEKWERDPQTDSPYDFARNGVLFGLATTIENVPAEWAEDRPEHGENRIDLALTPTTFARIDPQRCKELIYRGWWLAGASLCKFHRHLLPAELPVWRRPPVEPVGISRGRTPSENDGLGIRDLADRAERLLALNWIEARQLSEIEAGELCHLRNRDLEGFVGPVSEFFDCDL